jgi:3-oxoadipate CoA-transferase, alpha subunit
MAMADKVYPSADAAVADVPDGATVLVGGFAGVGVPWELVRALVRRGVRDLTAVNTACTAELEPLLAAGLVRKVITSWPVYNTRTKHSIFEELYRAGKIELELSPQGTLAERIRAGGAGIPAFYTPTGVGTPIAEGKPTATFDGREYLLERAIRGDVALVYARRADRAGNLVYHGSARNFNAVMAAAADLVIAEVDEIVEQGTLDPDAVVTPSIYVKRIVQRQPDARA